MEQQPIKDPTFNPILYVAKKIPMQFECQIHTHPQTLSLFMVDCLTGVSDGRKEHEGGLIKSDTKGPPQYCAKQPSTIERVILLLN